MRLVLVDVRVYLNGVLNTSLVLEAEWHHHNLTIVSHYPQMPRVVLVTPVWHHHLRSHTAKLVDSRPPEETSRAENSGL